MSSVFALLSAIFFAGNAVCVRLALRGSTAATTSVVTNIDGLWLLAACTGALASVFQRATLKAALDNFLLLLYGGEEG